MISDYLLILLALFIAVLGLFKDHLSKDNPPTWLHIILLVCLIFVAGLQIFNKYQSEKEDLYKKYSGKIIGAQIQYPALKNGDAIFSPAENYTGPLFKIGEDPIQVWVDEGVLKLTATIRDENGDIIAQIIGNDFIIKPGLIFDRNFDERAIEVINSKGDVILQVQMEPDGIQFAGKFYLKDKSQFAIGYNILEIRPPGDELQVKFRPIFKYPSYEHRGERIILKQ
jgi:hypothetical protein